MEYKLSETYLGGKNRQPQISTGTFQWQRGGNRILLSGKPGYQFLVSENSVSLLDAKGDVQAPVNNRSFTLRKSDVELTNKYWTLMELRGDRVISDSGYRKIYIFFQADSSTLRGFAGCNHFTGTFQTKNANELTLQDLEKPLTDCPRLQQEGQFLHALESVEYFRIKEDSLILQDAGMRPLAKFAPMFLR